MRNITLYSMSIFFALAILSIFLCVFVDYKYLSDALVFWNCMVNIFFFGALIQSIYELKRDGDI